MRPIKPLSETDLEIWRLFALGKVESEILRKLGLTLSDVRVSRRRIGRHYPHIRNLADLTREAVRINLITVS